MPQPVQRNWTNFFFGLLVALLPFLGLPSSFKTAGFVILGLLIAFFSLVTTPKKSGGETEQGSGVYEGGAVQQ